MYAAAGTSYVYICYGMHHLFNVVTNKKGVPDAVLVRAVEPLQGIDDMLIRTGKKKFDYTLTRGPGNVGKALGINKQHSGLNLLKNEMYIADDGFVYDEKDIVAGKRIGIDSAGTDALLPYRFYIRGNKFVSAIRT
jgi:DNA-3-methyladenine glycosylase